MAEGVLARVCVFVCLCGGACVRESVCGHGFNACCSHASSIQTRWFSCVSELDNMSKNTHRGARTHDHKVKGLALYRLS